jgi:hypothetical protein
VPDVGFGQACGTQRGRDRPAGSNAFRLGGGDVVAIGAGAHPSQPTVPRGAPSRRELRPFEHHHPGALAEYEPVPGDIERAGGSFGLIIAGAHGSHLGEPGQRDGDDARLGPAGHDHVNLPGPQHPPRDGQRLRT